MVTDILIEIGDLVRDGLVLLVAGALIIAGCCALVSLIKESRNQ